MTTLDTIFDLIVAVNANNTTAISHLLGELDAKLPPEEVVEIFEAIWVRRWTPRRQHL